MTIPAYDEDFVLRIELDERRAMRVTAEGWKAPMRHIYGRIRLCMW